MVKHIVMWSFREEVAEKERKAAAKKIKEGLEALAGIVPGLKAAHVVMAPISSSTHDLCLLTEFDTAEDLKAYATNPDHVKVAAFVRSVTCGRACMDYEE